MYAFSGYIECLEVGREVERGILRWGGMGGVYNSLLRLLSVGSGFLLSKYWMLIFQFVKSGRGGERERARERERERERERDI